jgi:hydroxymethylglutaryl-CoA lyase
VANAPPGCGSAWSRFDTTVGGSGGCPFAGQKGAAGNICTEELVLLCEEMGIATGVDLDALIEVGAWPSASSATPCRANCCAPAASDAFRRKQAA